MQATRRARLESVILQELFQLVTRELKDPRIPPLTFTSVQLTPEAELATVFVSVLGAGEMPPEESRRQIQQCLEGLKSARGFLRKQLSKTLTIRHVPELVFKEDKGFDNALRVHALLKQIKENE